MQGVSPEREAEDLGGRPPNRRERRRAKQVLAWLLKTQPPEIPETPEQQAQRQREEREDAIADFWNSIPASERLRLCMIGGAFGPKPPKPTIEPMPTEVISSRLPRIYE